MMVGKRSAAALLAVVVCAGGLAGCGQEDRGLPTLGGTATAASENGLVTAAKSFYDCMTEAGIDVELVVNSKQELVTVSYTGDHNVFLKDERTAMATNPVRQMTDEEQKAGEEFMNSDRQPPVLVIDGVDRTTDFKKCLDQSGYDEMAAQDSYEPDPVEMQAVVDATNQWTACAREHGWTDLKDAEMPTQGDDHGWPHVSLPYTTDEARLRQLLIDCPAFDPERAKAREDQASDPQATGNPFATLADPSIWIDSPPMPEDWHGGELDPDTQAIQDKIGRLYEILDEALKEYYDAKEPH